MGMKTESTVYVKGMRKRTESTALMGMPAPPVIIEQCDLQRTIKLNDKKKLYFIEAFAKDEEVIDEDVKPTNLKNKPVPTQASPQKGGIVNMWYNITDTGERKKMYGFTARHIWTSQKMKPSPDACGMKDSMVIKTDGWYIDLPQFNCPVQYRPTKAMMPPNERQKPDCQDKFVTHRSGKGKLGFPLTETRTIIMGNSGPQTGNFETNLETIELSTEKLDSMLFEIPPGYTETKNESDLQEKFDIKDMMNGAMKDVKINEIYKPVSQEQNKPGVIRIGVYAPQSDDQLPGAEMQQYLVNDLISSNVEAIAVFNEEEAKKYNCDYSLATEFVKIKQASKVGGLLKVIKNADPNAASSYNIESNFTLMKLVDGSVSLQQNQTGKYEGNTENAAKKSLEEESHAILKAIK
jgi:hypothetical protein